MNSSVNQQGQRQAAVDNLLPDILDAYWDDLSTARASDPEAWLKSKGLDLETSSQLRALAYVSESTSKFNNPNPAASDQETNDARSAPKASSLKRGELIEGKIRILGSLGKGGMGEVYLAWHVLLNREVAVKVLPNDQASDADLVARFRKSIAAHARPVGHPNIVAAMDAGQHFGKLYLVMEFVAGEDLSVQLRKRHPLPWREVCDWIRQAAIGLDHAHCAGLVHRDLKPSNLIRAQDGTIKVLDWGLARDGNIAMVGSNADADTQPIVGTSDSLNCALGSTLANIGFGTPDYISPEQAADAASANARSDLYSLGCTFYHLLGGKPPFAHHKTRLEKQKAHVNETPTPLTNIRDDIPPAVEKIIKRLTHKIPDRRYTNAAELSEALESVLSASHSSVLSGVNRDETRESVPKGLALTKSKSTNAKWIGILLTVLASVLLIASAALLLLRNTESLIWDQLSLIVAPNVDDESQPYDPAHNIVKDGRLLELQRIQDFSVRPGSRSGFKLEGTLNRSGNWAVIWIDTRGKFYVMATSSGTKFDCPEDGSFATVDPNDPPGTHLILVLNVLDKRNSIRMEDTTVSSDSSEDLKELSKLSTETWPSPPAVPSTVLTNLAPIRDKACVWRGPQLVARDTDRSYLKLIETRLPPNAKPLAAFFLRTTKEK